MFNYILQGQVKKFTDRLKKTNMFNLEDWLKRTLNLFNVPFYDECCPDGSDSPKPVRYNNDALEQYNGTDWEEIDVCSLCPTPPSSNKYFGSFYDTTDQTGNAGQEMSMSLNVEDPWNNGVRLNNNTQIIIDYPGVYNLAFSAQMVKDIGDSSTFVHIWLSQNGVPVSYSNSQISFPANSVYTVAAWNFFFETTSPQEYVELNWHISSNRNNAVIIQSQSTGIKPTHPETPGLIVTVNQVN